MKLRGNKSPKMDVDEVTTPGKRMVAPKRVDLPTVNSHLVCVLCGGYFVEATSIIECLHTFCRSCIVKYVHVNQFCPICDVQLHQTKPWGSLRPDKILQDIVYKLVPGLYQNEMARRREFYSRMRGKPDVEDGEERGSLPEGARFYSQDDSISLSLEYYTGLGEEEQDERNLESFRQSLKEKPRRYLQCPAAVTVRHLKKFLRMKYGIGVESWVDILYNDESLPDDFSLIDVAYTYTWKRTSPMRFSYRIFSKVTIRAIGPEIDVQTSKIEEENAKTKQQPSLEQQQKQSEYLGNLNLNPTNAKFCKNQSPSKSKSICDTPSHSANIPSPVNNKPIQKSNKKSQTVSRGILKNSNDYYNTKNNKSGWKNNKSKITSSSSGSSSNNNNNSSVKNNNTTGEKKSKRDESTTKTVTIFEDDKIYHPNEDSSSSSHLTLERKESSKPSMEVSKTSSEDSEESVEEPKKIQKPESGINGVGEETLDSFTAIKLLRDKFKYVKKEKRKLEEEVRGEKRRRSNSCVESYVEERKRNPVKRRKSVAADEYSLRQESETKASKSFVYRTDDEESNENLKGEALRKVFVTKEKPDSSSKRETDLDVDDGWKKKRKKSKHHDGESKRRKSEEEPTSPSILTIASDPLKLKVKLNQNKPVTETLKEEPEKSKKKKEIEKNEPMHEVSSRNLEKEDRKSVDKKDDREKGERNETKEKVERKTEAREKADKKETREKGDKKESREKAERRESRERTDKKDDKEKVDRKEPREKDDKKSVDKKEDREKGEKNEIKEKVERRESRERAGKKEDKDKLNKKETREKADKKDNRDGGERKETREKVDKKESRDKVDKKVNKKETRDKAEKREAREKGDKKDTQEKADKRETREKGDKKEDKEKMDKKENIEKGDKRETRDKSDKKETRDKTDKKENREIETKKETQGKVDKKDDKRKIEEKEDIEIENQKETRGKAEKVEEKEIKDKVDKNKDTEKINKEENKGKVIKNDGKEKVDVNKENADEIEGKQEIEAEKVNENDDNEKIVKTENREEINQSIIPETVDICIDKEVVDTDKDKERVDEIGDSEKEKQETEENETKKQTTAMIEVTTTTAVSSTAPAATTTTAMSASSSTPTTTNNTTLASSPPPSPSSSNEKDRLLHLRQVRHKNPAKTSVTEIISAPPSLTISKVDGSEPQPVKPSVDESKPSLEIVLVNPSENKKKKKTEKKAEPQIKFVEPPDGDTPADIFEGVLDLSGKSSRTKDSPEAAEKSRKILEIAQSLVSRKMAPMLKDKQFKNPFKGPGEASAAAAAMRNLKTLSDTAVNILLAAQSKQNGKESEQSNRPSTSSPPPVRNKTPPPTNTSTKPGKDCDKASSLKIPTFPIARDRPIPPVPNLQEIFPRGRGRPRPLMSTPVSKPGQNQTVRQIPNPFAVLNRQNSARSIPYPKPEEESAPSQTSKQKQIPPLQSIRPNYPPPLMSDVNRVRYDSLVPKMWGFNGNGNKNSSNGRGFPNPNEMNFRNMRNGEERYNPMRYSAPNTSMRRMEHMTKNIESVAAGLTARAASNAMVDAK